MSVDKSGVVDAIGIDQTSGELVLTIADHLAWSGDNDEHLLVLQEKLNTYMRFIESGEITETYPDGAGRSVAIDVVCKHTPSDEAAKFFKAAARLLGDVGVALRYRVL